MYDDPRPPDSDCHAYALLRGGVPLTLLCDLAIPVQSRDLLVAEPADTAWLTAQVA